MTCRKAMKLIPLYAGDDLRPRLGRAVRDHIDACPACRRELEDYRQSLARVKAAAGAEAVPVWSEGEWISLMARVAGATGAGEARSSVGMRVFRPRWAAASVLGAFLCLVVLSMLFRGPSLQPGRSPSESGTVVASDRSPQDKVAITLVSPETGLQVVWFFDKNFEWKGDQQ
jgi:hypothetical protein